MTTQYVSPVKFIPYPASKVFGFLSSFDNFERLLPPDKISNWTCAGDNCNFYLQGIGPVGLKIDEKIPDRLIKYTSDGKIPFNFFLYVQLKPVTENGCEMELRLQADLNPILEMMVADPAKNFLETLSNAIADYPFKG